MIDDAFLAMLACPESGLALERASAGLLDRLNEAIRAGQLRNRLGEVVATPLTEGLLRADGRVLYAVVEDIPMLLADEGILLDPPVNL